MQAFSYTLTIYEKGLYEVKYTQGKRHFEILVRSNVYNYLSFEYSLDLSFDER